MNTEEKLIKQAFNKLHQAKLNKHLIQEISLCCKYFFEFQKTNQTRMINNVQLLIKDSITSFIDMSYSIEALIATNPHHYIDFKRWHLFLKRYTENEELINSFEQSLRLLEININIEQNEISKEELLIDIFEVSGYDLFTNKKELVLDVKKEFNIQVDNVYLLEQKNINQIFDLVQIFDEKELKEDLINQLFFYSLFSGDTRRVTELILAQLLQIEFPIELLFSIESLSLSESIGLYLIYINKGS